MTQIRKNRIPTVILSAALTLLLTAVLAVPAAAETPRDPSAWKNAAPEAPAEVLIQNATIWTSGPDGILENTDLLVRDGKIAEIGEGLEASRDAVVIDAEGHHVTPGIIDAHSHSAIVGGVNESTQTSTAEVRIEDVVNSESIEIYRQLAGGVTAINLLHGSANPIGGQNAVIKMRWGALPEDLLIDGAPSGIKFALGENPKRSNFGGDNPDFPSTRQGVERSIRDDFRAALAYRVAWDAYRDDPGMVPPKRDLDLETLLEILDGERLVHAHSYRADEILMLVRLAEEFGFRVASFQHVLEGYKVADELAAHGAGASTFSDWWAYKFEVIEAIPYNGAIMEDRKVVVSYNSDSSELARRLNLEAAKAVRYGGVPEAAALQFVTLNPAIQLGIDDRVGSLEVGKDADFVLWNGSPLSTYSRCEQTWIEGRKYFDRDDDLRAREAVAAERRALLEKVAALEADKAEDAEGEGEKADAGAETEKPETDITDEPPPKTPSYLAAGADHDEFCFAHGDDRR